MLVFKKVNAHSMTAVIKYYGSLLVHVKKVCHTLLWLSARFDTSSCATGTANSHKWKLHSPT